MAPTHAHWASICVVLLCDVRDMINVVINAIIGNCITGVIIIIDSIIDSIIRYSFSPSAVFVHSFNICRIDVCISVSWSIADIYVIITNISVFFTLMTVEVVKTIVRISIIVSILSSLSLFSTPSQVTVILSLVSSFDPDVTISMVSFSLYMKLMLLEHFFWQP